MRKPNFSIFLFTTAIILHLINLIKSETFNYPKGIPLKNGSFIVTYLKDLTQLGVFNNKDPTTRKIINSQLDIEEYAVTKLPGSPNEYILGVVSPRDRSNKEKRIKYVIFDKKLKQISVTNTPFLSSNKRKAYNPDVIALNKITVITYFSVMRREYINDDPEKGDPTEDAQAQIYSVILSSEVENNDLAVKKAEFKVNDRSTFNYVNDRPSISGWEDSDEFVIVWQSDDKKHKKKQSRILFRIYKSDGTPKTDVIDASSYVNQYSTDRDAKVLCLKNGTFVISWSLGKSIYLRIFDANGKPMGNPVFINSGAQSNLVELQNDNYMIYYTEMQKTKYQRMSHDQKVGRINYILSDREISSPNISKLQNNLPGGYFVTYLEKGESSFDLKLNYVNNFNFDRNIGNISLEEFSNPRTLSLKGIEGNSDKFIVSYTHKDKIIYGDLFDNQGNRITADYMKLVDLTKEDNKIFGHKIFVNNGKIMLLMKYGETSEKSKLKLYILSNSLQVMQWHEYPWTEGDVLIENSFELMELKKGFLTTLYVNYFKNPQNIMIYRKIDDLTSLGKKTEEKRYTFSNNKITAENFQARNYNTTKGPNMIMAWKTKEIEYEENGEKIFRKNAVMGFLFTNLLAQNEKHKEIVISEDREVSDGPFLIDTVEKLEDKYIVCYTYIESTLKFIVCKIGNFISDENDTNYFQGYGIIVHRILKDDILMDVTTNGKDRIYFTIQTKNNVGIIEVNSNLEFIRLVPLTKGEGGVKLTLPNSNILEQGSFLTAFVEESSRYDYSKKERTDISYISLQFLFNCPNNFFPNSSTYACQKCLGNFNKCANEKFHTYNSYSSLCSSLKDKDNYYLTPSNTCQVQSLDKCDASCLECEGDPRKCTKCRDNTAFKYYPMANNPSDCRKTDTVPRYHFLKSDNKFYKCDKGCFSCKDKSSNCVKCSYNFIPLENVANSCIDRALGKYYDSNSRIGYYLSYDKSRYLMCKNLSCKYCQMEEPEICEKNQCNKDYFPLEDNLETCIKKAKSYYDAKTKQEYYFSKDDNLFKKCDKSCFSCEDKANYCFGCKTNYFELEDDKHTCIDPNYPVKNANKYYNPDNLRGYYFSSKDKKFKKCNEKCKFCDPNDKNKCLECNQPNKFYGLFDRRKTCVEKKEGVDYNYYDSEQKIYYYFEKKYQLFYKCNEGCEKCSLSPENCVACKNGYLPLSNNKNDCRNNSTKPINYYNNSTNYAPCEMQCGECENTAYNCTKCAEYFEPSTNKNETNVCLPKCTMKGTSKHIPEFYIEDEDFEHYVNFYMMESCRNNTKLMEKIKNRWKYNAHIFPEAEFEERRFADIDKKPTNLTLFIKEKNYYSFFLKNHVRKILPGTSNLDLEIIFESAGGSHVLRTYNANTEVFKKDVR